MSAHRAQYPNEQPNSDDPLLGSPKSNISSLTEEKPIGCPPRGRISIEEIANRLCIGRRAVYSMLEQCISPGVRLGRRWIVTLAAYEAWERTCGTGFHRGKGGNV